IRNVLKSDSDVIYVSGSNNFKDFDTEFFTNKDYFETYSLDTNYFSKELLKERAIPIDAIQKEGEAIWNATVPNGPPLIGLGKNIVEENDRGQPIGQFAILAYIRTDKLLKTLQQVRLNEVFVLNQLGDVLIHSNPFVMQNPTSYAEDPLFKRANSENLKTSAFKFDSDKMLGAYSKSYNNQIVV